MQCSTCHLHRKTLLLQLLLLLLLRHSQPACCCLHKTCLSLRYTGASLRLTTMCHDNN
jgi:hypothetical protein